MTTLEIVRRGIRRLHKSAKEEEMIQQALTQARKLPSYSSRKRLSYPSLSPKQAMEVLFSWSDSEQGFDFWHDLAGELGWHDLAREMGRLE